MSNSVHRQDDARSCGATTNVIGQSTVYAGGKLISVDGDTNSHGSGALIAATNNIYINGKMVVNVGDSADPDDLCIPVGGAHCAPAATGGLSSIKIGD